MTDNGSHFVKAFREYQQQQVDSEEEDEEARYEEDENVTFTDIHSVLNADDEDAQNGLCVLPPHHRCAAHTLNLIPNNEVDTWLGSNPESRGVYRSATAKCSAMWTKACRSSVASEYLEEVGSKKLIGPTVPTRWNSYYNAYARIAEMPLTVINNICTKLQIKCMNEREYLFLKEYCTIMKPFTIALDILQGEDTCFYGTLQPALEVLISKTLATKNDLSQMTIGLPEIIVRAIKSRFANVIDAKEALLSAVSLPKFKLRWVKDEDKQDFIKTLLTTECRTIQSEEPSVTLSSVVEAASISDEEDFFTFEEQSGSANESVSAETEVLS